MNNFEQWTKGFVFKGNPGKDAIDFLQYHGKDDVVQHTKMVAAKAKELAEQYGVNADAAFLAGCLHDVGRAIDDSYYIELCKKNGVEVLPEEAANTDMLHQKLSKILAKELFHIKDELVLSAIECHSTLKAQPSRMDMILLLADKTVWEFKYNHAFIDEVLRGLESSVETGAYAYIKHSWNNRHDMKTIHPWLKDAYLCLSKKCN